MLHYECMVGSGVQWRPVAPRMTAVMDLREILVHQPCTSAVMIVSLLSLALILLYWTNVCCEDTEDGGRPDIKIFISTLLLGLTSGSGAVLITAFYQVTANYNSIFVKASQCGEGNRQIGAKRC